MPLANKTVEIREHVGVVTRTAGLATRTRILEAEDHLDMGDRQAGLRMEDPEGHRMVVQAAVDPQVEVPVQSVECMDRLIARFASVRMDPVVMEDPLLVEAVGHPRAVVAGHPTVEVDGHLRAVAVVHLTAEVEAATLVEVVVAASLPTM